MKTNGHKDKDTDKAVVAVRQEKRLGCGPGWKQALDVDAYDEMLAAAYLYVRDEVMHLTLSEVARRSKVSRPFWRKVVRQVFPF